MKATIVDSDGNVRCRVCGANQFSDKRTGKATLAGVVTLGVGVPAMPKRLKCRGCGENLKRGEPSAPVVERPQRPTVDRTARSTFKRTRAQAAPASGPSRPEH